MKTIYVTFRVKENFGDGHALTPFIMERFNPSSKWRKWRREEEYTLNFYRDETVRACNICRRTKKHFLPHNSYRLKLGYLLCEVYK